MHFHIKNILLILLKICIIIILTHKINWLKLFTEFIFIWFCQEFKHFWNTLTLTMYFLVEATATKFRQSRLQPSQVILHNFLHVVSGTIIISFSIFFNTLRTDNKNFKNARSFKHIPNQKFYLITWEIILYVWIGFLLLNKISDSKIFIRSAH